MTNDTLDLAADYREPVRYDEAVRRDFPMYEAMHTALGDCAAELQDVRLVLDLGIGTGETSLEVLRRHPHARFVGVDIDRHMMDAASAKLGESLVDVIEGSFGDGVPEGPFDLVVSAFAVAHLDDGSKRTLYDRIAMVLRPGGRFVCADLCLDGTSENFAADDFPASNADMVEWLTRSGLSARVAWTEDDLSVICADRALEFVSGASPT